ncbi:hypothetical protein BV133_2672 [Blastochloris viridis]|uniref:Uncharacterized protein n=1 Tax=Blastochloris viridis TaxID=1079 RepID=A0A182D4B3_BLAVI|nr:hypothetical protein BV133_2672 [Blastochloris viridis]
MTTKPIQIKDFSAILFPVARIYLLNVCDFGDEIHPLARLK